MLDNKNLLHYAKFTVLALILTMIWLTANRSPKQPTYSSGKPKSSGAIVNGKAEGIWSWWYPNGQKMSEGIFVAGKRNGTWTTWYEDGSKKSIGIYADDRLNGQHILWYKNGEIKEYGHFINDKKHGLFSYYDLSGILKKKRLFEHGVLVRDKTGLINRKDNEKKN